MPSTFKSLPLFNSGPHRFSLGPEGQKLISEFPPTLASGSLYLGLLERRVIITGRLIAESEAALWTLRDAITAELLDPPAPGTLTDHHGRSWPDMSFVRFTPSDRTDRARLISLPYTAEFLDLRVYP